MPLGLTLGTLFVSTALASDGEKGITRINGGADVAQPGKRHALLIGIEDYNDAPDGFADLRFAVDDAEHLAEELRRSSLWEYVTLHRNPSRIEILQALDDLSTGVEPGDSVLFYFSGHGISVGKTNYVCPRDSTIPQAGEMCVSMDTVRSRLNRSRPRLRLIVVDACRSEQASGKGGTRSSWVEDDEPAEGLKVLYSTKPGLPSWESEEMGLGVFTHFLVEGMKGQADRDDDGYVDTAELDGFVKSKVLAYSRAHRTEMSAQMPYSGGDYGGGRFRFIEVPADRVRAPTTDAGHVNNAAPPTAPHPASAPITARPSTNPEEHLQAGVVREQSQTVTETLETPSPSTFSPTRTVKRRYRLPGKFQPAGRWQVGAHSEYQLRLVNSRTGAVVEPGPITGGVYFWEVLYPTGWTRAATSVTLRAPGQYILWTEGTGLKMTSLELSMWRIWSVTGTSWTHANDLGVRLNHMGFGNLEGAGRAALEPGFIEPGPYVLSYILDDSPVFLGFVEVEEGSDYLVEVNGDEVLWIDTD